MKIMYKNQIVCGNCVDIMIMMPDNYIDLTVTSPPYDILKTLKRQNMELYYADHFEAGPGEIFIGWFTETHIKDYVTWETKRIGTDSYKNKYPLFILLEEVRNHKGGFKPQRVSRDYFKYGHGE